MEILAYTEDHHRFRSRMRAFLEKEITPWTHQWEADHITPKWAWQKLGRAGFLCTGVSPEYGGMGGDFLYSVIAAEEMAKTNHTGLASALHSDVVVPYIQAFGSEDQKKKYLPGCVSGDIIAAVAMTDPDAGSDLAAMPTTAVEKTGEIEVNGAKTFISNGINAGLVIVAAKDPDEPNPYNAVSLYIVEDGTPGFKRGRHLEKWGFTARTPRSCFSPTAASQGKTGWGKRGRALACSWKNFSRSGWSPPSAPRPQPS
jgi:alkylation response protein AidB-like acyl-CoA dehydrogenase